MINEIKELDAVGRFVVQAAFSVHTALGPGLPDKVYTLCLAHELKKSGLAVDEDVTVPIRYDDLTIEGGLQIPLLVNRVAIIELKNIGHLGALDQAILFGHLRLMNLRLGYIINFNMPAIKDGIHRIFI